MFKKSKKIVTQMSWRLIRMIHWQKNVLDPDSGDFISKEEAKAKAKAKAEAAAAAAKVTSTEVKKPQVVTIDDPKALHALASSAAKSKAQADKDKVTIIDTAQILAGRSNSGVTITPAAGASRAGGTGNALPGNLASSLAASGVTISSKSTFLPVPPLPLPPLKFMQYLAQILFMIAKVNFKTQ